MTTNGLSNNAIRLLSVLKALAAPATDAWLADACNLHKRDIIDVAGELLAAGYLVLADGRGRWLGTVEQAAAYLGVLERRAKRIFRRRRAVRNAIDRHRRGQLKLFGGT